MAKYYHRLLKIFVTGMMLFILTAHAQVRIAASGAISLPTGQLDRWFKNGSDLSLTIARGLDYSNWVSGVSLFYSNYSNDNLTGYAADHLELSLKHWGIWAEGRYLIVNKGMIHPFFSIAGGPVYWKGIRGEIQADEAMNLPNIEEKVLEEWNMGFRTGFGAEVKFGPVGLDILAAYRFVVGSLWPTMQEHIELDGVNGFQSFYTQIGLFYEF